ncbi:MAG: hypothetical protein JRE24_01705, partial [Deltaproteobacteria bacterium]|nr:hypothetical protein [Deltaproteobacteria bacterium]
MSEQIDHTPKKEDDNFVDGHIHDQVISLLSKTRVQLEWVESLVNKDTSVIDLSDSVDDQDNEADCIKWIEYLERVEIALAEIVSE